MFIRTFFRFYAWAFQVELVLKHPLANAGDVRDPGLIPGLGRSPGRGNGNPLQYSCLENPTDRGDWQTTVHRVVKSQTRLKRLSLHVLCTDFSTNHLGVMDSQMRVPGAIL